MKKLEIKSPSYNYLEKAFKEWLDILGYAPGSRYNMPHIIREFLHYLEQQGKSQITQLQTQDYQNYFNHISTRPNQKRGGGLSNNYLNKHLQSLEKFYEFLIHKGVKDIPPVNLRQLQLEQRNITVLTETEINALYQATTIETHHPKQETFNARDRAMLTVFYGCGLRRTEGVHLSVDDINFDQRLLHVRKGKNYKERFVPFSKTSTKHLQEWVYDYRPTLIKTQQESALFIGLRSRPMTGSGLYVRLKLLQLHTEDIALQQKEIGLHTLRHSIATHLLANGMELQKIQRFLGHTSLESTQLYTHLINQDHGKL